MFVLMDMEWYEDKYCWFITQVSALRIDEDYNILDRFDSPASPAEFRIPETVRWNDFAFSGRTRKEILLAPNINSVFTNLYRWLEPDDILTWWHAADEEKFINRICLMGLPFLKSRVVGNEAKRFLAGRKKGSPYILCNAYGIPTAEPEHCSSSYVRNLHSLLSAIRFPLSLLKEQEWRDRMPEAVGSEIHALGNKKSGNPIGYVYEKKTKLLHKAACILYSTQGPIAEITLQRAVEMRLTPCPCCRDTFEKAVIGNAKTLPKSTLVYSTAAHGHILHHSNCPAVKQICPEHLRTMDSAVHAKENGFRFCKTCSSIEQYYKPLKPFIDSFCTTHGLKYILKSGAIHIISQFDRWIISVDEETGVPTLYHKNKKCLKEGAPESAVPGYHLQPNTAHTIPRILRSIANHDRYKENIPFTESPKKHKKKGMDKEDRRFGIQKKRKQQADKIRFTLEEWDEAVSDYYG